MSDGHNCVAYKEHFDVLVNWLEENFKDTGLISCCSADIYLSNGLTITIDLLDDGVLEIGISINQGSSIHTWSESFSNEAHSLNVDFSNPHLFDMIKIMANEALKVDLSKYFNLSAFKADHDNGNLSSFWRDGEASVDLFDMWQMQLIKTAKETL